MGHITLNGLKPRERLLRKLRRGKHVGTRHDEQMPICQCAEARNNDELVASVQNPVVPFPLALGRSEKSAKQARLSLDVVQR